VAKVSVLYINDEIVSPHLELLRNICEPKSRAKPHVTVRFFRKIRIPLDHLSNTVSFVDLLAPGAFFNENSNRQNRTVFIRCQANDLLHLEYKPLFPTSEFHITIYDGVEDDFAHKLFETVKKYKWEFRLPLPPGSALTAIDIKNKRDRKKTLISDRVYSEKVMHLFKSIFSEKLTEDLVFSLSEKDRLKFADVICKNLQRHVKKLHRVSLPIGQKRESTEDAPATEYDLHLTPPELALEMATHALNFLSDDFIDFGDPAVGTGVFYAALLKANSHKDVRSALGIDISQKQIEAAKWRWKSEDMELRLGDFLQMSDLPIRNFVLANPPYMRHQGIGFDYKMELRQRASLEMGFRVSAQAGQYVYFILLSHKWLAVGAICSWLIPSEFMQTGYGKALRLYFSKKVQLLHIHQFDAASPQFENAEVLPCVVVFRNVDPLPDHTAVFSVGGTLLNPVSAETVELESLDPESKWSIPTRPVITRDATFVRLGALFSVKRGIATGMNKFFVMERKLAEDSGLPSIALRPILPKAMLLKSDVIKRKRDGYPSVEPQMCVLDCSLPEHQIEEDYPRLFDYLKSGESQGVRNGHLVGRRTPWYKQEQREPAPFLCTYMGKAHGEKPAIRFILNRSDAIATNTYLLMYPNPSLTTLLKSNPEMETALFEALKRSSWGSIDEFTRSHAGGLSKIEPRELEEVWLGPLPEEIIKTADKRLFN
jgi:adenine-specific DNA-methyltransferase